MFLRYGEWGVCFTYATWFATKGLAAAGKIYEQSPTIRKATEFLLKHQQEDGGWGESYLSCPNLVSYRIIYFFSPFISFNHFFSYMLFES